MEEAFTALAVVTDIINIFIVCLFLLLALLSVLIYRYKMSELRNFKELEEEELNFKFHSENPKNNEKDQL